MANVRDLKTEEGWREEASKLVMEQAPSFSGSLRSLGRSSRIDEGELVQAAQQEEQDKAAGIKHRRKHHLRGRTHGLPKIDSAAVAGKVCTRSRSYKGDCMAPSAPGAQAYSRLFVSAMP